MKMILEIKKGMIFVNYFTCIFLCRSLQISMRSIYLQCVFYCLYLCVVPALFSFHFHLQALNSKNHLEGDFSLLYVWLWLYRSSCNPFFNLFFILIQGYIFIDLRERGIERETLMWRRNIDWLCPARDWGSNL